MGKWLFGIALLLLIPLYVVNTLNTPIYPDDRWYLARSIPRSYEVAEVKRLFSTVLTTDDGRHFGYIPLTRLSLLPSLRGWNLIEQRLLRLQSVILHLINGFLLYFLTLLLVQYFLLQDWQPGSQRKWLPKHIHGFAVAVAVLFFLHPVCNASTLFIYNRGQLIGGCFFLLTFLLFIYVRLASLRIPGMGAYLSPPARFSALLFCLLTFCCALLSSSAAFILPMLFILIDVIGWTPMDRPARTRSILLFYSAIGGVVLLFVTAYFSVMRYAGY